MLDTFVGDGWCTSSQLVVWVRGERVVSHAAGESRPGIPMAPEIKVRLDCAVKPVVALGLLWLRDRGLLRLDEPVSTYIPEFSRGGKESITPHHLLTHTAGLFTPAGVAPYRTSLAVLLSRLFDEGIGDWRPGVMAAYDTWGGWYTLAAIIERVTGASWSDFLTEHVLNPIGASELELVPGERPGRDRIELPFRSLGGSAARGRTAFPLQRYDRPDALAYPNPAYGGYASMETLTAVYRAIADRERCLDLVRVDPVPMTTPQRPALYDHTMEIHSPYGYGLWLRLDAWNYCDQVSSRAFGHSSDAGTWAFCDPEADLILGLRMNGVPNDLAYEFSRYRIRNGHPVIRAVYNMVGS
jgi:CubicO group peptidase (beta-lactamase class C family)